MPHVNSSGGDDLASTDEVKVYKDEGEEEKRSSENLSEEKLGLVTETEEDKNGGGYESGEKGSGAGGDGKTPDLPGSDRVAMSPYLVSPYYPTNGATLPGSLYGLNILDYKHLQGSKHPLQPPHPGALTSLMMYNNEHLASPPPAHMGIPPVHIDPKTGLPRPPMYAIPPPPGQFPHPLYSPEFSQVQWNGPPGYPITTAGFRGPYPTSLSSSGLARFSPGLLPHHMGGGLPHQAIITPGPKQDIPHTPNENHRSGPFAFYKEPPSLLHMRNGNRENEITPEKKRPYVKKPLNAFMLFMKEQRAKVIQEGTLKESAAINQILGRKWHALDRSEQAKYYEMARKEKELHMQLYPGWSARDNYAAHNKKKKRKREPQEGKTYLSDLAECPNQKKCRARYGVDQQNQWCKPCRRKKKCIRYLAGDDGDVSGGSDDDADDASKVDSTTTDGDLESMGSPMRLPCAPAAPPTEHDHRPALPGSAFHSAAASSSHVTSSAASSSASQSSSSSSSSFNNNNNNNKSSSASSYSSAHPIGFLAPSRPGVNHPIEKLCGGTTPPPQLQRPPGHPSQATHDRGSAHHQYGVPSSSSGLAASSPIVPAIIAT